MYFIHYMTIEFSPMYFKHFKTIEGKNYNIMYKFHTNFYFLRFPSNLVGMITSPLLIHRTSFSSFGAILNEFDCNF